MSDRSFEASDVALKWTLCWDQFDNALGNVAIVNFKLV
jgi:hypothetical protein